MTRTPGGVALLAAACFLVGQTSAHAEDEGNIEHTFILGVGAAGELELPEGSFHSGANVMVEWDVIENWLELEAEVSILSADGGVEVPFSVLAKKPFRVTRRFEFMLGLGPEVVHVANPTTKATYFGGQVALDFMFWPSQRIGLWIEPSYDLIFRNGASSGVGATGGVLMGW